MKSTVDISGLFCDCNNFSPVGCSVNAGGERFDTTAAAKVVGGEDDGGEGGDDLRQESETGVT